MEISREKFFPPRRRRAEFENRFFGTEDQVARPRFSISGIVESIFSMFTSGISSIVNNIVGSESKSNKPRVNRVSYKGHQLLRITPITDSQVSELQEMMESNDDGLKFWTMPAKNR